MIVKMAEVTPGGMGAGERAGSADLHAVAAVAAARLTHGQAVVVDAVVSTGGGECARNSFPNSLRCRCYYLLLNVFTAVIRFSMHSGFYES